MTGVLKCALLMFAHCAGCLLVLEGSLAQAQVLIQGPSGGDGGSSLDACANYTVKSVTITSGQYINSISVDYDDQACCHRLAGSTARDSVTLPVPPGDRIIGVSGRYGKYVDHIKIWTAQNPVGVEAGGPGGAVDFEYHALPGTAIIGFMGRAGQYIDAVGVCMRSQ